MTEQKPNKNLVLELSSVSFDNIPVGYRLEAPTQEDFKFLLEQLRLLWKEGDKLKLTVKKNKDVMYG